MIRKPDSRHNLHSVHLTRQPLGVECMQCQTEPRSLMTRSARSPAT